MGKGTKPATRKSPAKTKKIKKTEAAKASAKKSTLRSRVSKTSDEIGSKPKSATKQKVVKVDRRVKRRK